MSWRNKVVWSQGMFLLPHHFQQEARYLEQVIDSRVRATHPFAWGYGALEIDEGLLAQGKLGIARAIGVLPDGTPFSIPQFDPPPPPLDIPADLKNEVVHLTLALARRDGPDEVDQGHSAAPELARYTALTEALRDNTDGAAEPEEVQTGQLRLKLLRTRDLTGAHTAMSVALVQDRTPEALVRLDRGHIPPAWTLDASAPLPADARLVHTLVRQRAQAMARDMGQLSHGTSEISAFLMLQLLNRHEPLWRQIAEAPTVHPRALFELALSLAGELATFTTTGRRPPDFPLYRHDDLRGCFAPVWDALRTMLAFEHERLAQQIPLVDRGHNVHTAVVPSPELIRSAAFVLAVNAQLPAEQLRLRFPAQSKVGPAERIRQLVNSNLPGLGLRSLPTVPRELPFHAGFHYFDLERSGELWQTFAQSGNLALFIAGEFPGLELELWAIRSPG